MGNRRKDWTLAGESFERLLNLLDPDRDRAGLQYERIREKLRKFFEWRGCAAAEEYADKTLDRVARTVEQGTAVRAANPYTYIHGVALNVLHEYRRDPATAWQSLSDESPAAESLLQSPPSADSPASEEERRLGCLDECLRTVPGPTRELLLKYHGEEGRSRIDVRQRLADGLGIPLNALRIRMFRVRVDLEKCIVACVGNQTPAAGLKQRSRFRH